MQQIKNFFKRLKNEETAQGATEYILLLVVVVAIVIAFGPQIKQAVADKTQALIDGISQVN